MAKVKKLIDYKVTMTGKVYCEVTVQADSSDQARELAATLLDDRNWYEYRFASESVSEYDIDWSDAEADEEVDEDYIVAFIGKASCFIEVKAQSVDQALEFAEEVAKNESWGSLKNEDSIYHFDIDWEDPDSEYVEEA
jgi:hypothetical protein